MRSIIQKPEYPINQMRRLPAIVKSPSDSLTYRAIKLPNDLDCILVQDPEAKLSAAVMNVGSGSFNDPKSHQGIAHFLEHMLFMGSEKYPVSDKYREFINNNGGSCNAYTDVTSTVFYHSVKSNALVESLDIFAQFFVAPLMQEEFVNKELNAVHSEHLKNLNSDIWRESQLFRHLAKPETVFHGFGTGNLSTLKKPDIYDQLKEYHKRYYSANIMKLVIYGNESLDALEKHVEAIFSPITNNNVHNFNYIKDGYPYDNSNLNKVLKMKSIKKEKKLKLVWFLDSMLVNFRMNPLRVFSHLIGHESEGSILSVLLKHKLAYELSCGPWNISDYFTQFQISITLTDEGFENIDKVVEIVGGYLNMLRREGIQQWVFDELKTISDLQFNYGSKGDSLSASITMAENMGVFPVQYAKSVGYLLEEYRPDLYNSILDKLVPSNMIMFLSSDTLTDLPAREPVYGTEYSFDDLPKNLYIALSGSELNSEDSKNLHLPPKNYFLPKEFSLKNKIETATKYPVKIQSSPEGDLFYKLDDKFNLPKINIEYLFYLHVPSMQKDPQIYICFDIWKKMLLNYLRDYIYLAEMAKIEINIVPVYKGLKVEVRGFNDCISMFLEELAHRITTFTKLIDDPNQQDYLKAEFDMALYSKHNELDRILKRPLFNQVLSARSWMLMTHVFSLISLQTEVSKIAFSKYTDFHKHCFESFHYDAIITGNYTKAETLDLNNRFIGALKHPNFSPLPGYNFNENRVVHFESQRTYVIIEKVLVDGEKNDCVLVNYQYRQDPEDRHIFALLASYIETPFFEDLRTNQQLGYVVFSMTDCKKGVWNFQFLVQSDKITSQECSGKIYEFVEKHRTLIRNMEDEVFEGFKNALVNKYLQPFNNLTEETNYYYDRILQYTYDFEMMSRAPEVIKKITKQDVIDLYEKLFYEEKRILEIHYVNPGSYEKNKEILKYRKLFHGDKIVEVPNSKHLHKKLALYPDIYSKLFVI